MELSFYLLILALAMIFAFKRTPIASERVFLILFLVLFLIQSLVVRQNYDWDMENYARSMSHTTLSIYYLKEPVVWLGQRYLFSLLGSTYWVFVIFDMMAGFILYLAYRKNRVPQYCFFSILLFFPFVLGLQNVYRQWVSFVVFSYTLSLVVRGESRAKSLFGFTVAVLSHNVAAVFLPLVFLLKSKMFGRIGFWIAVGIAVLGLFLGSGTKSDESTGLSLDLVYLGFIMMLLVMFVFLDRLRVDIFEPIYWMQLVVALIVFAAYFALSSAGTERVAMYGLLLLYPYLALKLEGFFRGKTLIRLLFVCLGFFPIFFFETSEVLLG